MQQAQNKTETEKQCETGVNDDRKILVIPGTTRGGCGKSTCMMLVSDYLRSKGRKIAVIDTDTGNYGKPGSFSHYFGGKCAQLDLRRPKDLDHILEMTAETEADAVLCDIPANAHCSMADWFSDICTPDTLDSIGIRLVAVGVVTQAPGSVESVLPWLRAIGPSASYLIALNRIEHDFAPEQAKKTFEDWFDVDTSDFDQLRTIEVPHLHNHAMTGLIKSATLPSKLNGEVQFLVKKRIEAWTKNVHKQIAATGLL